MVDRFVLRELQRGRRTSGAVGDHVYQSSFDKVVDDRLAATQQRAAGMPSASRYCHAPVAPAGLCGVKARAVAISESGPIRSSGDLDWGRQA